MYIKQNIIHYYVCLLFFKTTVKPKLFNECIHTHMNLEIFVMRSHFFYSINIFFEKTLYRNVLNPNSWHTTIYKTGNQIKFVKDKVSL